MLGTSFFRSNEDKCPQCGHFGAPDEEKDDAHVCPSCSAMWNEYVLLRDGQDVEFQNH